MKRVSIVLFLSILLMLSCKQKTSIEFTPLSNYPATTSDTTMIEIDMDNVVLNGIAIPSVSQSAEGIEFKANTKTSGEYYYKIYYQNESYKFNESEELSYENFYGSWEDTSIEFKPINDGKITDYIRIVGNPRNERKYFGAELSNLDISEPELEKYYSLFRSNPDWLENIRQKAIKNKFTLERQMFLDALWMIDNKRNEGETNHRWKRNPRTGSYSFLLVVCDKAALESIPYYIKDISKVDTTTGKFVNPYTYFLKGNGSNMKGVEAIKSNKILRTRAVLTPKYGVYVDPLTFKQQNTDIDATALCNNSHELYETALFQQFFHSINQNYTLRNIPTVADVAGNQYTREEYENNAQKYTDMARIFDYPHISTNPCNTVIVEKDYIKLVNPGNEGSSTPRKESVGIVTRVGFTYGKFIGKIKFPELLNEHNVYNGLTNAFWLIFQSGYEWNERRESKSGYISKDYVYQTKIEPEKRPKTNYSEIDIEIVKTSRNWPDQKQTVDEKANGDVMFCCTNWDMSCADPARYGLRNNISYKDNNFYSFRWDKYYAASTIRTPIPDDEMFKSDYYYYEIEWKPNEIIWRVGPSLDKMKIMGYTSDKYTVIPDNQMTTVVTQEYHYSEWWPPVVYDQNNIPFPKSDIVGKVFEIIIE